MFIFPTKSSAKTGCVAAMLLSLASGWGVRPASAATLTWNGTGANAALSTKQNWNAPPHPTPAASDLLVFPNAPTTPYATNSPALNDLGTLSLDGLSFQQSANLSISGQFFFDGAPATGSTVSLSGTGNVSLTGGVRQTNAATNMVLSVTNSGSLTLGPVTNAAELVKNGGGTVILSSTSNSYTGTTRVNAGTLQLGASNVLPTTTVVLNGGTLNTAGFSDTVGALDLDASSLIRMNETSSLVFAASNTLPWTGTLSIWNWNPGVTTMRFGTSNTALTAAQLANIKVYNGAGTDLWSVVGLNANGFLVVVPEPGAVMAGIVLLGAVAWRERRQFLRVRADAA